MRVNPFVSCLLTITLLASCFQPPTAWANKATGTKPTNVERQQQILESKIEKIERLLAIPEIRSDASVASVFIEQWTVLSCQHRRLEVQQLAGDIATKSLLDKIEANCQPTKHDEAAKKFVSVSPAESSLKKAEGALKKDDTNEGIAPPSWCVDLDLDLLARRDPLPGIRAVHSDQPGATPRSETQLNAASSGAELTTKNKVFLAYINRLRFDAELGGLTQITAMPSIPAEISAPTAAPVAPTTGPKGQNFSTPIPQVALPPGFAGTWESYSTCMKHLQNKVSDFQTHLASDETSLNRSRDGITSRLQNVASKVIGSANEARSYADDTDQTIFPATTIPQWPAIDIHRMKESLKSFQQHYAALSKAAGYSEWVKIEGNQKRYDDLNDSATAIANILDQYSANPSQAQKSEAANFDENRSFVMRWYDRFQKVAMADDESFVRHFDVSCKNWFGQGSKTQMQLSTHDLLNPDQKLEVTNLDTVVCNSALTITSGLGLSFIPERLPAFVPTKKKDAQGNPVLDASGNPVIVQSLGFSSDSRVRPAYSVQVNTAIWEAEHRGVGLHWMLGTSLTAASQGATLDFLVGPALSFRRRTFFISPVYDLGLRTDLLNQFSPGDVQGNLTSPPTQQRWHSGFGLSITFPFSAGTPTTDSSKTAVKKSSGDNTSDTSSDNTGGGGKSNKPPK